MHTPRIGHLNPVYKNFKHLKKSPRQGIMYFKHDHLLVEAYTDTIQRSIKDQQPATVPWYAEI